jgi:peroxiredoxin Q/BCP
MKTAFAIGAIVASAMLTTAATTTTGDTAPGPGASAPTVVLQSVIAGKTESYDLQTAAAKRPVVLYFFPKAFTGGCTIEAKTFAAKYADFDKLGYDVVGASTDDVATLTKFAAAESAPQRFVSDPSGAIAKAFGIATEYQGQTYAGRVTYVIGTDGKIMFKVADDVPQSNVASTMVWVKAHPFAKGGS